MLFTRCPECETTFRITEEALQKAGGQVRCGRCTHIFNAYKELREHVGEDGRTSDRAAELPATDERSNEAAPERPPADNSVLQSSAPPNLSGADLAYQEQELEAESQVVAELVEPEWMRTHDGPAEHGRRLWARSAALAVVLLLLQAVNHYRAALVDVPVLGPVLRNTYAIAGIELTPQWDVGQYDLLDWVAVAEPTVTGQGNLVIRSRVQNAGPRSQPYPFVHLRLLDRWEKTVGSRVFGPNEYMRGGSNSMMAAGATAEAELVIVDPGPDTYGFELDVCVRNDSRLSCATDRTFR